jgi:type IV secretion system protein VirD4
MAKRKKEASKYTLLIYALLIAGGAAVGIFTGAAMDAAVSPETGKVVFSEMKTPEINLETVMKVLEKGSRSQKGAYIGGGAAFLFIANYVNSQRRFHRRGEEHGSAAWGNTGEKQKLRDKGYKIKKNGKKLCISFKKPFFSFQPCERTVTVKSQQIKINFTGEEVKH